jgi:RHS repeat-associated protein
MSATTSATSTVLQKAGQAAQNQGRQSAGPGITDVMTHTWSGLTDHIRNGDVSQVAPLLSPLGLTAAAASSAVGIARGVSGPWASASASGVASSASTQAGEVVDQLAALFHVNEDGKPRPEGFLQHFGAAVGVLTSIEQGLSSLLSVIPFPAFPAVRILDFDVGLPHIHMHPPNLIPPAPPVPLPSTGPVIPIPIMSGATSVLVNGMPAARCGDMGLGIWCGGYFPMYEIFLGSSSVWIEGARAARVAVDITKHCVFSSPQPEDPPAGPMVGLTVSSSPNVLIGGIPLPSLTAMAMGAVLRPVLRGLGKVTRALAAKLQAHLPQGSRLNRLLCVITGHPVDVATGRVFTSEVDFELPGPIPLIFERNYDTSSVHYQGPLGVGWSHSLDMHLWADVEQDMLIVRERQGRKIGFDRLEVRQTTFNPLEKCWLRREAPNWYVMWGHDHIRYHFRGEFDAEPSAESSAYRLVTVEDANGKQIRLSWRGRRLDGITDSAGRHLSVQTNSEGRILQILAPHPNRDGEPIPLVTYCYDAAGDLVEVRNALGDPSGYAYHNHMLILETDRNGLSFYFEYDGEGPDARCTRTWGDGGIYARKLTYDLAKRQTTVVNSLGNITVYGWNALGAIVRETEPLGGQTVTEWDNWGNKLAVTGPDGHSTCYEYDEYGRSTAIINAMGQRAETVYDDAGNRVSVTDVAGATWRWEYDDRHNAVRQIDPSGSTTEYEYDRGQMTALINPAGNRTQYAYNAHGDLIEALLPGDARWHWAWDSLGRCLTATNPRGATLRQTFDVQGRPQREELPEGIVRSFAYDKMGYCVDVRGDEGEQRVSYWAMGKVARQTLGGRETEFQHDTEGRLTAVVKPGGGVHRFEHDAAGRVITEVYPGGGRRSYLLDIAGRVSRATSPSGKYANYTYDPLGRLLHVNYSDGEVKTFRYRADGQLLEAQGTAGSIKFEYDAWGKMVKEWQGSDWVASTFDPVGYRTEVASSFGAQQRNVRNGRGEVENVSFGAPSGPSGSIAFRRDLAGVVVEYQYPGHVRSTWERDGLGRPVRHTITSAGWEGRRRTREYEWEGNDRIRQLADDYFGTSTFDYDSAGGLVSARYGKEPAVHLADPEALDGERDGRAYGPDGELLAFKGTRYEYDADGQLVRKIGENGWEWQYLWGGDGLLREVRRPDGERVTFTYDGMGRRLSKQVGTRLTRWIWDGNNPLHELQIASAAPDPGELTTWVFEPSTCVPLAKAADGQALAIVTDLVGAPLALFGQAGQEIWAGELDIRGRVRKREREHHLCPFRFAGQYEDVETGLYYNRFRYYDPDTGRYISRDPIGLHGGTDVYAYVRNPLTWTDPGGLTDLPTPSTVTPPGLMQFGKKSDPTRPSPPRVGTDVQVDPVTGMIPAQKCDLANGVFPDGKSATIKPEEGVLTNVFIHETPAGTQLPEGMAIVYDGSDVVKGSNRGPGHHTIYNTRDMPPDEFLAKHTQIESRPVAIKDKFGKIVPCK